MDAYYWLSKVVLEYNDWLFSTLQKTKAYLFLGKFRKKNIFKNTFLIVYGLNLFSVLKINIDT